MPPPPAAKAYAIPRFRYVAIGLLVSATVWALLTSSCYTVEIVDVVPLVQSDEAVGNPEPAIAVNRTNPKMIAVSAYALLHRHDCNFDAGETCGPCEATASGVVLSADGGDTWEPRCAFTLAPDDPSSSDIETSVYYEAADLSLGFSGTGDVLYGGYLSPYGTLRVMGTRGVESPSTVNPTLMTTGSANDYQVSDQPFLKAWGAASTDVVVVGVNQNPDPELSTCWTGLVWWWDKGVKQNRECATTRLDGHGPNQAVRLDIHDDGTTYGIFYHRFENTTPEPGLANFPVVVLTGGTVAATTGVATGLVEAPGGVTLGSGCSAPDNKVGIRVACGVPLGNDATVRRTDTYGTNYLTYAFGRQRRQHFNVAVAVDPRDNQRVVVAYLQERAGGYSTLKLLESTDGGRSPFVSLLSVDDALNPAIAISQGGRIGFLYQRFEQTPDGDRWRTYLRVSNPDHTSWNVTELSDTPAWDPGPNTPYIGDYVRLEAVNEEFFGVFSANNDPQYHPTAKYVRTLPPDASGNRALPSGVAVSIDPFFFRASPASYGLTAVRSVAKTFVGKIMDFFDRPPPDLPEKRIPPTPGPLPPGGGSAPR